MVPTEVPASKARQNAGQKPGTRRTTKPRGKKDDEVSKSRRVIVTCYKFQVAVKDFVAPWLI